MLTTGTCLSWSIAALRVGVCRQWPQNFGCRQRAPALRDGQLRLAVHAAAALRRTSAGGSAGEEVDERPARSTYEYRTRDGQTRITCRSQARAADFGVTVYPLGLSTADARDARKHREPAGHPSRLSTGPRPSPLRADQRARTTMSASGSTSPIDPPAGASAPRLRRRRHRPDQQRQLDGSRTSAKEAAACHVRSVRRRVPSSSR